MELEKNKEDNEFSLMNIEIDDAEEEKYKECINISSVFKSKIKLNKLTIHL
jgi:hypothetical protein